ncbi:DinB family protein [Longitalea arenae]|uniref:DinB family protein n=1 Tax=Longitalea arenae TaxID=2812558 RepID=UPI001967A8B3|nr:DinB family protein [Longitalea arenae]
MTDNHSLFMYEYHTWANKTLISHLQDLPDGSCRAPIKSVFPSIFEALMHVYIIDKGWLSLLMEEYQPDDYNAIQASVNDLIASTKNNSLQELEEKQQVLAEATVRFIMKNDMADSRDFAGVRMSYADVIQHIVNHGTYHRGNITAMLHQLGHKGVPTDYGLYLYHTAADKHNHTKKQ